MQAKRPRSMSTQSMLTQSSKGTYGKKSKRTSRSVSQKSVVSFSSRGRDIPKWGFPRRMYIAHKYCETVLLTMTNGSINGLLYRANGMFDPRVATGGHQPMYFDNLSAIYDHYTVVKSKCKFTVVPNAQNTVPIRVTAYVDDDGALATTLDAASEMAGGSIQIIPAATSTNPLVFYKDWSARTTFGGDPLSNDQLQGTGSADPVEQSTFAIQSDVPALASITLSVTVEIVYYAIWDELKTQSEN